MVDVIVIGAITIDQNTFGRVKLTKLGGVVSYAGMTYRRHGAEVMVITNVGPADTRLVDRLDKIGIRVRTGKSIATTSFVNIINGDRRRQKLLSIATPINSTLLPKTMSRAKLIHLGPIHSADIDRSVFRALQDVDVPIVLDLQGFVRRVKGSRVVSGVNGNLSDALGLARIVKADQIELETVLEAWDLPVAKLIKEFQLEEIVVTRGKNGGRVHLGNGEVHKYSADHVSEVIDSTGAGDVFFSAYCYSRLVKHHGIEFSCKHAAKIAARQVAGKYIRNSTLDLEDYRLQ